MFIPWPKSVKLAPRSAPWIVGVFVLAFTVISLGVLLSDVTRDDVVALYHGFDGSKFSNAEVGSFFEVSSDNVHGPLCSGAFTFDGHKPQPQSKAIVVINKLGNTLPILTIGLGDLFLFEHQNEARFSHTINWSIEETSVASDALWVYTRGVLNAKGSCGKTIDERTRSRDVRICPVHRVWKNDSGQTVALFFDPYAINGCTGNGDDCSSTCPLFVSGQVWTELKLKLDLIEVGA